MYWRSESGGIKRRNIDAWCLECFENNFTVPTLAVTILFSHIVGYADLSGSDRRKALTLMSVFRDAADRVAREYRGRLVETVSDDVLLEFEKSPDALNAARNLQDEFHESARKLNLPTPGLRSGIHYGNVKRSQDGALLGDTVEIASRVQGIAEVGQIVLSGRVVDQLKDKIELEDLGERSLENVPEPVRCWAVGN